MVVILGVKMAQYAQGQRLAIARGRGAGGRGQSSVGSWQAAGGRFQFSDFGFPFVRTWERGGGSEVQGARCKELGAGFNLNSSDFNGLEA